MRFCDHGLLAFALYAFCLPAFAATAPIERKFVASIQRQQDDAVRLLEQVVNINSGTMNLKGVRAVADVFEPKFKALGFRTRWADGAAFGRAGHLIAERGERGPHILLIAHLDTVFELNSPFQRFERVDANTARGPGTSDMKGGIVVALVALSALNENRALDDMKITIVMHGDEEDAGTPLDLARADLINAAKAADIAIGLENAADDPKTAVTGRRSSSRWELQVTGKTAHSSQIFSDDVGAGAAYELARILNGFYNELRGDEFLTFNPGLLVAGAQLDFKAAPLEASASGKDNIIVPQARASGDLRAISLQQIAQTKDRMRKIVAAHLPHTSAQIEFFDSYPPMTPTEGNKRLLGMYDSVSRDLGFGSVTAVNPRRAGAADVSFAADHVEMSIDGLGLLGGGAHTAEEFADLRTMQIQAQRLAVLMYRLSKR
ncbi:MAG TPA: M20/M25/M40 family metallo-hydrolase [Steroidobacteraceae bacterium]|nr:M20/M25/M40 family metallo-hydrolase [Steroidobacteraceae bacterium]